MLDTGYRESLHEVINNIYRVGLDPHEIKYILLTHGHIDHLGAARAVRELVGAKIVLGRADREYANGRLDLSYAKELGMVYADPFELDILVDGGDTVTLGKTTFRAVATPGHTPGSVCLICNGVIFSGDTLFADSCGRTDFPGSDPVEMTRSLKKLAALPGDYDVLPGHGDATTLSYEREHNPYMRGVL